MQYAHYRMATKPMIITCPSCHTKFEIAPSALGSAGRTVRCSSCGARWFVDRFADAAPTPPLAAAPPMALPEGLAVAAAGEPRRRGTLAGWLLATLALLLLTAAVAGRNEIAARLPAAVPFYRGLGLSIDLPIGMEFRQLSSAQRAENGRQVLVVSGEIANVSTQERELPPIRVALLDSTQQELDFGLFDPPQAALEPGALTRFEVQLGPPPPEASNFTVSFGALR